MSTELFSPTGTTVVPLPGAFLAPVLPSDATLLIRSDASHRIGAGHIMRCVALAQEWTFRGGTVLVAANELTDATRYKLDANNIAWVDVGPRGQDFRQLADEVGPAWVVLDVGPVVHEYLAAIDNAYDVLAIDDLGGRFDTSPTLVLNQNAHGPSTPYAGIQPNNLLRGLEYILLRDEFLGEDPSICGGSEPTVLVAMGGTDPLQLLPDLVDSLACNSKARILAVASSGHPQLDQLETLSQDHKRVELHLDVSNMAQLMKQCDLALTSGGTTVWELAYLGIPSVVGAVAEVEDRLLAGLNQIDLFETIGRFEIKTADAIAEIVLHAEQDQAWLKATRTKAQEVVDGHGRLRVLDRMASASRLAEGRPSIKDQPNGSDADSRTAMNSNTVTSS